MIVGIDLGTTNSLVACCLDGEVKVIPNRLGKLYTPSVVALDDQDHLLVGEIAKEYSYLHPQRAAKVFKRTMGTNKEYTLGKESFLSEELSSLVLKSLIEDAETFLHEKVEEAIISVPAYFNDNQRKATKKAGELLGIRVSRIINEPTASALAYGVGAEGASERCLVFDLGGGTFDVSILEYFKNIVEVRAIAGDNNLGGEDFTLILMKLFLSRIGKSYEELDLYEENSLYKAAESAKCLFENDEEILMSVRIAGTVYSERITLTDYEVACRILLAKLNKPIQKALSDTKMTLGDIDRIILVGGATRLPIIRKYIAEVTGSQIGYTVDPTTAVAVGAALQVAMKQRQKQIEEFVLTDVCPYTLGTEVIHDNGVFVNPNHYLPIIERNTIIPVSKTERVFTAHDNQSEVVIKVLQGESRIAQNNLLLGEITLDVPVGPKGKEALDITYTYDINSLLQVEATVISNGNTKKIIINNGESEMSDEEMQQRFEKLQYLKQNPRDEEQNALALLKGNRLYEESSGSEKEQLGEALDHFEYLLANGTRVEIDRKRKELEELFESLENQGAEVLYS